MANIYVNSVDGSDSDDGSTRALAKATITGAAAIDAAGDTIYIDKDHAESTASALSFAFAGTRAAPSRIISCDFDTAEPPTAKATGATITTTGTSAITFTVGNAYVYGLTFNVATGGSTASFTLAPNGGVASRAVLEDCNINLVGTSASSRISISVENLESVCIGLNVKFAAAGQGISVAQRSIFKWVGGGIAAGGTSPTTLFAAIGANVRIEGSSLDLSQGGSTMNLFTCGSHNVRGVLSNIKLPASWTGSLVTGTLTAGERYELYNGDSGDTNYRVWIEDFAGSVKSETVVVRTGGQSDGTTALSYKMAMSANAEWPAFPIESVQHYKPNNSTGSALTLTVEILHFAQGAGTSGALQTDEVELNAVALETSGFPLGSYKRSGLSDVLGTPSDYSTSTESWDSLAGTYSSGTNYVVGDIVKPSTPNGAIYMCTTDAGTTAAEPTWGTTDGGTTNDAAGRVWTRCNRQKLTVSVTPQEKGVVQWWLSGYKASKTVWYCGKASLA